MRSSSSRRSWRTSLVVSAMACAVSACSPNAPDARNAPAPGATGTSRASDEGVECERASAGAELRRGVESGPFFAALTSLSPLQTCRIRDDGGALVLDYAFADGGRLHVERDASIEYSMMDLRYGSPQTVDATALLQRAEDAAFGAEGCGIDWSRPVRGAAGEDPSGSHTAYRGKVCNCQAEVRSTAAGDIVGLVFRSAC